MDKNPHVAEMRRVFHKTRLTSELRLDAKIVGGVLDYVETLEAYVATLEANLAHETPKPTPKPTPEPASKIRRDELQEAFGDQIPMEAIAIVWNAEPEATLREVRRRLEFFIQGWKARLERK